MGLLTRKPIRVKRPGPKGWILETGWAVPGTGVIKRNGAAPEHPGEPVRHSISRVAADSFTRHPRCFWRKPGGLKPTLARRAAWNSRSFTCSGRGCGLRGP